MEKTKRHYFIKSKKVSILIISFTLLFSCLFLFKGSGLLGQLAGFEREWVEEIAYNQYGFPIIPEKFLACKKNRDCVLATDPCGTIAVHKSYKSKYKRWREKAFAGYVFDCMNDLSHYEPQCVNFKCEKIKVEDRNK